MTITFLGTGTSQGVPVIACDCEVCNSLDFRDKRTRTSIHIEVDGQSIVIDTGPDFRQQILRERIHKLDAIIFTHQHRDHTGGLDDVRSFNFKQKSDMPIYGSRAVIEQLKKDYEYIFNPSDYPGVPKVIEYLIDNNTFRINNTNIIPIYLLHHKLPVFGFRIYDFTYITDANYIDQDEKEKIIGSKILVINALQKKHHISHFNLQEALDIISELKPEKAYLTHISHYLGQSRQIEEELPDNVMLAYDGLKIDL